MSVPPVLTGANWANQITLHLKYSHTHTHTQYEKACIWAAYERHHVNEGIESVPGFTESVTWLQLTMSSVSTEVKLGHIIHKRTFACTDFVGSLLNAFKSQYKLQFASPFYIRVK